MTKWPSFMVGQKKKIIYEESVDLATLQLVGHGIFPNCVIVHPYDFLDLNENGDVKV